MTTKFEDTFSEEVWNQTYKDHTDKDVNDTFRRVAKTMASNEKPELQKEWEEKFYDMLSDFKVTVGGRIYANAGTDYKGTTFLNCFTSPLPKYDIDSIDGIYEMLENQAKTLKSEGGWGSNFSFIRPRGSFIHGIGVESPGVVKFMELFDKSSEIITSGSGKKSTNKKAKGKIRKGAMMGILNCFSKNSKILTNKGYKTFEEVCDKKDKTLKAVTEHGEFPIVDWIINPPQQLYLVEDELGHTVEVTHDHKFMVYNTITKEEYLKPLNEIDREIEYLIWFDTTTTIVNKHYVKLKTITPTVVDNTYDVTVHDKHMLIANGFYTSNCWHPDVIEFITAKQTPGRLTKFNMSVNCTEKFMNKINKLKEMRENNAPQEEIDEVDKWDLVFPDTTHPAYKKEWQGYLDDWEAKGYPIIIHNTVSATWLWNLIMESTYNRAEPGVLFLDRANYLNPLSYREKIFATNPCLTGETMVAVADGRGVVSLKQLADEGKDVPVFCLDDSLNVTIKTMRNPRITGYNQEIFKITLDDGNIIRATGNHKFMKPDGTYVQVKDMVTGESLKIVNKIQAGWDKMRPNQNSKSQDYLWFKHDRKLVAEHVLISGLKEKYNGMPGYVVHHKDRNGLNNHPDNLQVMTKKEHHELHAKDMIGDKNPMRRAQTEWSEEKWQQYHNNMSASISGEKNGRYNGTSNEELLKHGIKLAKQLGRRFSTKEWEDYAKLHGISCFFKNTMRKKDFAGAKDFSIKCTELAGIDTTYNNEHPTVIATYMRMLEQGYKAEIIDGKVMVYRTCEHCGTEFMVKQSNRERAFCSVKCNNDHRTPEERIALHKILVESRKTRFDAYKEDLKIKQVTVYNDLKFNLREEGRKPLWKEWENGCKAAGIAYRLGISSPFRSFKDLQQFAETYNHRVVSVEHDGFETVYNGTVDEYHNFLIGGFEYNTASVPTTSCKKIFLPTKNCGEAVLEKAGICQLSSLNLTQMINDDATDFDYEKIEKYAGYMVRFLDNSNDITEAPLPDYKDSLRDKRRIGCGILGWGSALYMLKTALGSDKANTMREKVLKTFSHAVYKASIDLAKEKGAFPLCIPEKHADIPFLKQIEFPEHLREEIRKYGVRNSALLSCQPTGNTSILANIVSGGIEPVFMAQYTRTIVSCVPDHLKDVTPAFWEGQYHETSFFKWSKEGGDDILKGVDEDGIVWKIDHNRGLTREVLCEDYGVRWLKKRGEWDANAEWAKTTNDLTVEEHLNDLCGFAKYMDSSVSKTVCLPNDYPFEDFKNVYLNAYNMGFVDGHGVIKGLTTYRNGSMSAVLSSSNSSNNDSDTSEEEIILDDVKMSNKSTATIQKLKAEGKKYYLTTVFNDADKPFAIFVNTNNKERSNITNDAVDVLLTLAKNKGIPEKHIHDIQIKFGGDDNITKIARSISLLLRHGVLIKNIVFALESLDVTVGTFIFAIRKHLSQYIKDGEKIEGVKCEVCGGNLVFSSGCSLCQSCGNSKCG